MTRGIYSKAKSVYVQHESEVDGVYQLYSVHTERFGAPILVPSVEHLSNVVQHLITLSKPGEVLEGQTVKLVFIGYFDSFTGEITDCVKVYHDVCELEEC